MNLQSIKIRLDWNEISRSIQEASGGSIREAEFIYGQNLIFKCRVKGGIPAAIFIDYVKSNSDAVILHVDRITLFIKLPEKLKNNAINELLNRYINIDKKNIEYDMQSGNLTIKKDTILGYLPFSDLEIGGLYMDKDNVLFELNNVKIDVAGVSEKYLVEASAAEDITDLIDTFKNVSPETEFHIEKAKDYYDNLRNRIETYVKSGIPSKFHYLIPYLFLLPDVLTLLIRLFGDKRVDKYSKAFVIAGILYIISPIDLMPDFVLPFGIIDDLGIGFFVLDKLILNVPENVLKDNFSGSGDVIGFIKKGYSFSRNMIPSIKMDKILKAFNKVLKKDFV